MRIAFSSGGDFTRIVELTPALRRRIEAAIEHLLGVLDLFDGEADGEPWLGWPESFGRGAADNDRGDNREAESDFEPETEDADLGWLERLDQRDAHRCNAHGEL